ncbi:Uncharacterized protein ChrSV_0858 [Chromobacterium vaccinii]|nr:Uncharacterized protein ChrSW_0858 [Chromobacterium vaccinii]QND88317.1 Uncharacterized protein ChrSV_0858 [Chromobacterium vaccinii]
MAFVTHLNEIKYLRSIWYKFNSLDLCWMRLELKIADVVLFWSKDNALFYR